MAETGADTTLKAPKYVLEVQRQTDGQRRSCSQLDIKSLGGQAREVNDIAPIYRCTMCPRQRQRRRELEYTRRMVVQGEWDWEGSSGSEDGVSGCGREHRAGPRFRAAPA